MPTELVRAQTRSLARGGDGVAFADAMPSSQDRVVSGVKKILLPAFEATSGA
jgi:hypothetical protein